MAGQRIEIDAGGFGLVLGVGDDGRVHQLGFGRDTAPATADLPTWLYPLAYPTFGEEHLREPALRITHGDGATSTRLVYRGHHQQVDGRGTVHRIELADRVAPVRVTLCVRPWPDVGLIEQWVEVTNDGSAPCTLHQVAASAPSFTAVDPHLTHWGGGWANEWTETTERIASGTKTVASAGGVRSSLHLPPLALLAPDGIASEVHGRVAAVTVAWGGDVRFDVEAAPHGQLRVIAGAQHRGAERILDPGASFSSPPAIWAWSETGIGPTSRALHRYAREHVVRDGGRTRATVVNTWEALFFALDPERLGAQVDVAADLGGELFLLDDGWFGTTHPRDDDTTGLGDWEVDRRKFPHGLQPLIDRTLKTGMRFGLWVEPEMVNPASSLYEDHPDWVIAEAGRDRREERNQLVLDLCRPEVAAFCLGVIDRVLTEHPGISYLKWDANRDVTEPGSGAAGIATDRQSHLPIDRVRATYELMAEVGRRHPDVELMACASGGGRGDFGTLRYFHEIWTSDNTDPLDRVRIQWGASHLLPASVLGAHVTRWGNKPLAIGCAVAMSGRFGLDLDLQAIDPAEREILREAVATYARIRDLVQHGQLYRLVSPIGTDRASLAYVDDEGDRAVAFAYRLADELVGADEPGSGPGHAPPLAGLLAAIQPSRTYVVRDITPGRASPGPARVEVLGADVASAMFAWPAGPAPAATIWEISAG
ncbi:MAG: glycoside hydrolase clan [Acidimicrobiales bacterium]|nr:glycoside hydrolase clan [Acidimicrobiales bacterium]